MSQPAETRDAARDYWERRQNLIYYRYVERIVRGVAPDAQSMIDVGSSSTSIIEWFDWVPIRHTLDKRVPYSSERVRGVKEDFLKFHPERRFDLALCLQVLEHIPKAGIFSRKLFDIAHSVLISVPYQWPKGDCKHHVHDPVDQEKLQFWTKRKPDYQIIVEEPLGNPATARRLIAYYHGADKEFSLSQARNNLKASAGT